MAKRPASSKPSSASPRRKQTADERRRAESARPGSIRRCNAVSWWKRCGRRSMVAAFRSSACRASASRSPRTYSRTATTNSAPWLLYRKLGDGRVARSADGAGRRTIGGRAPSLSSRSARYEYTVEGWVDRFATWRRDLIKKVDAGQDVASELLEGSALIRETAARAQAHAHRARPDRDQLAETRRHPPAASALAGSEELAAVDGGNAGSAAPQLASIACSA